MNGEGELVLVLELITYPETKPSHLLLAESVRFFLRYSSCGTSQCYYSIANNDSDDDGDNNNNHHHDGKYILM